MNRLVKLRIFTFRVDRQQLCWAFAHFARGATSRDTVNSRALDCFGPLRNPMVAAGWERNLEPQAVFLRDYIIFHHLVLSRIQHIKGYFTTLCYLTSHPYVVRLECPDAEARTETRTLNAKGLELGFTFKLSQVLVSPVRCA